MVLFSGCGVLRFGLGLRGGPTSYIQGQILGLNTLSATNVSTLSCSLAKINLYRMDPATGAPTGTTLATEGVQTDGSFKVPSSVSGTGTGADSLILVLKGCSESYSRIVTGNSDQTVSAGTSLLSWVGQTSQASTLATANRAILGQIYANIQTAPTSADAYATIVADPTLTTLFQGLFLLPVAGLQTAAPLITSLSAPNPVAENATTNFTVQVTHWNPVYVPSYEWIWKGVSDTSSGQTRALSTGANDQGPKVLRLLVGLVGSGGHVDTTKPYTAQDIAVTVTNTFPAVVPPILLTTPSLTNSLNATLQLQTGAALAACANFSYLAVTENSLLAPLDPAAYTISCTRSGTQNIPFTLSMGDGTKILRIWAIDSAGLVSAIAQSVSIVVDQTPPTVSVTSPATDGTRYQNTLSVAGACESGATQVTVGGSGTSSSQLVTCTAGAYLAAVSLTTGEGSKEIVVAQADAAGNSASVTRTIVRDNTAPVLSATSATAISNNQDLVSFTGTCESGLVINVTGSSTTSLACTSGQFSFSPGALTDAARTYSLTQTDQAGNVSAALAFGWTRDTVAPTIALTTTATASTNSAIAVTVTLSKAVNSFTSSQLALVNGTVTGFTGSGTAYSFTLTPLAEGVARVSVAAGVLTDAVGNTNTASNLLSRIYDTTAPTISSFQLAGGAAIVAVPVVSVSLSANDGVSAAGDLQMRLSENAAYANSGWQAYQASGASFNLSQTNGSKTIYVWVKDAAGNVSADQSTALTLDFGAPPVLSVTSPVAGSGYTHAQTETISWNCQPAAGSAVGLSSTAPIPSLSYTTDEGLSFTTIVSTGLTVNGAGNGSYNWAPPAALDGVAYKIQVTCQSASGVITAAYSQPVNSGGWSIFAGDAPSTAQPVSALNAFISNGPYARTTTAGDAAGNIYYGYHHAIMKMNGLTGLVSRYAGSVDTSGCTLGGGGSLESSTLTTPIILGMNTDQKSLLIATCGKVVSLDTQAATAVNWASMGTTNSVDSADVTLTKDRWFVYIDFPAQHVYRLNLATSGHTPEVVFGRPSGSAAVVGADARTIDFSFGNAVVRANHDASRVWLNPFLNNSVPEYQVDFDSVEQFYKVTSINSSPAHIGAGCRATDFDDNLYCVPSTWTGRQMIVYDPINGTWVDTINGLLPFPTNDDGGILSIGTTPSQLVVSYSLNTISIVTPHLGAAWAASTLIGQPLSTAGNTPLNSTGNPALALFASPFSLSYELATQTLYVPNSGHLRAFNFSTSPTTISTTTFSALQAGGFFNSFAVNPAGTQLTYNSVCGNASAFLAGAVGGGSWTMMTSGIGCGYMTNGTPAYPLASGTNAQTAANSFVTGPNGNIDTGQRTVYHSNGKIYFGAQSIDGLSDVMVWETDGTTLNIVAGHAGIGGYSAGDSGGSAIAATLSHVFQVQEITSGSYSGDLLIWDRDHLRRLGITTDTANSACPTKPCLYDILDLTTLSGYSRSTVFDDNFYDSASEVGGVLGTGTQYYATVSGAIHKVVPNASLTGGTDTAYAFNGTSISRVGNYDIRLALTPVGLLILQPNKNRILRVDP